MSITEKLEKYYKNQVESIKNMKKGIDRDRAIGALVADLGKRCLKAVANAAGCCFRKAKKCHELFISGTVQLSLEFRGRKRIMGKLGVNVEENFLELIALLVLADGNSK